MTDQLPGPLAINQYIDFDNTLYQKNDCCGFRFTNALWGSFSNFSNHPVKYLDRTWKSSEALYQAGRFTDHLEIVEKIFDAEIPALAKQVARSHDHLTRTDWGEFKIPWMHDVLALKLVSNPAIWREIDLTGDKPIVEVSTRDTFWGASSTSDGYCYLGSNILGKLWMLIRERDIEYYFKHWRPMDLPYLQKERLHWIF